MFATGIPSPPQIFQTYLLPALPFRRRKSSSDTVTSTGSFSSTCSSSFSTSPGSGSSFSYFPLPTPSGPEQHSSTYLSGATSHISCARCHADLALTSQIISKGFTGRHGRAYLVAASPSPLTSTPSTPGGIGSQAYTGLPNTHTHKPMPRHLVTGLHTVCDISCAMCGSVLGWKYVSAEEETQRYKVGKFILETRRVAVGSCWENDDGCDDGEDDGGGLGEDDVAFDSQDEDECEDLFAGIWSPQLAKRRRGRRVSPRPAA